jgi:hypothetical protein
MANSPKEWPIAKYVCSRSGSQLFINFASGYLIYCSIYAFLRPLTSKSGCWVLRHDVLTLLSIHSMFDAASM